MLLNCHFYHLLDIHATKWHHAEIFIALIMKELNLQDIGFKFVH